MKQPHTESGLQHTDDQQNTGNHPAPDNPEGGPDKFGGTRAGAENVEGTQTGIADDQIDLEKSRTAAKPSDHD